MVTRTGVIVGVSVIEPIFVGRDELLARLREAIARSGSGTTLWFSVQAEPGLGKSAFLDKACSLASGSSSTPVDRILRSRAYESARVPPYTVIEPIVRDLWLRITRKSVPLELERVTVGLAVIAPYLATSEDCTRAAELDLGRQEQAVDAFVSALLVCITRSDSVMVALDDIHRADEQSIRVIGRLFMTQEALPLLIVTARRPAEVSPNHTLDGLAEVASRTNRFVDERITALSPADARAMAKALGITGKAISDVLVRAGGHPLLLRWIATGGGASDTVARFVRAATDDLAPVDLVSLTLLALHGREVDTKEMGALLGMPAAECERKADDWVRRMLFSQVGPGTYRVFHALVRDELIAQLSAREIVQFHADLGRAIENADILDEESRDLEIGYHLLRSPHDADRKAAVTYAVRAAARAEAAGAWEDALGIWTELEDHVHDPDPILRADMEFGIARCLFFKPVDYPAQYRGRKLLGKALATYVERNAFDRIIRAATNPSSSPEFDLIPLWEEALSQIATDFPGAAVLAVRVCWNKFYLWNGTDELEAAVEMAREWLTMDDPPWLSVGLGFLAMTILYWQGDLKQAGLQLEKLLPQARTCRNLTVRIPALMSASSVLRRLGSLDRAEGLAREAYDEALAARGVDVNFANLPQYHLQRFALARGDWSKVLGFGHVETASIYLQVMLASYYTGQPDAGDRLLQQLIPGLTHDPSHWIPIANCLTHAVGVRAYCTGNDHLLDQAVSWARELFRMPAINPQIRVRTVTGVGRIAFLTRNVELLTAVDEELAQTPAHRMDHHLYHRAVALCSWGRGRPAGAQRAMEEALKWCDHYHDLPIKAWTHFDLSRIFKQQRESGEAQRHEQRAMGLAKRLGMVALVDRLSEGAPELELVRRLTTRELEVLKLLAAGFADKQIAKELGVSTYTASNHVRHIRGKLNCASRSEAVAAALRLGVAE